MDSDEQLQAPGITSVNLLRDLEKKSLVPLGIVLVLDTRQHNSPPPARKNEAIHCCETTSVTRASFNQNVFAEQTSAAFKGNARFASCTGRSFTKSNSMPSNGQSHNQKNSTCRKSYTVRHAFMTGRIQERVGSFDMIGACVRFRLAANVPASSHNKEEHAQRGRLCRCLPGNAHDAPPMFMVHGTSSSICISATRH